MINQDKITQTTLNSISLSAQNRTTTALVCRFFIESVPENDLNMLEKVFQHLLLQVHQSAELNDGFFNNEFSQTITLHFNAIIPASDHAESAVMCALDLRAAFKDMKDSFLAESGVNIELKCGLHTGIDFVAEKKDIERFIISGETALVAKKAADLAAKTEYDLLLTSGCRQYLSESFAKNLSLKRIGKVKQSNRRGSLDIFSL